MITRGNIALAVTEIEVGQTLQAPLVGGRPFVYRTLPRIRFDLMTIDGTQTGSGETVLSSELLVRLYSLMTDIELEVASALVGAPVDTSVAPAT
jgi:hypothetical protein